MRREFFNFQSNKYTGAINTTDIVTSAYGNNYLDIEFNTTATPANVSIVYEGLVVTLPTTASRITPTKKGVFFSLEWIKYHAPKHGIAEVSVGVQFDNVSVRNVSYKLTAGREEIETKPLSFTFNGSELIANSLAIIGATQFTPHWNVCEILRKREDVLAIYSGLGYSENEAEVGITEISQNYGNDLSVYLVDNASQNLIGTLTSKIQHNDCPDIEIRITNRHGLRGVMGGKLIDASEGGDDVKSNFATITPYQGINRHQKIGQKIQKEVFFDCGGDADLLGLLRDACVYGVCEWYDEHTAQWLPCQVVDNSLDTTDAYKEQSITFILQEL